MVLTAKMLDEILDNLDTSIENLARESFGNFEGPGGFEEIQVFLQSQFDIRLENSLAVKNSSIHHLESGMKNKIIQRKQLIINRISKQYKN
ncbi:MAG: hypothetical protein ACW9XA_04935 [Candidatus Nitrosopumilus sp. bin_6a]